MRVVTIDIGRDPKIQQRTQRNQRMCESTIARLWKLQAQMSEGALSLSLSPCVFVAGVAGLAVTLA